EEALDGFRLSRTDGTIELRVVDRPQLKLSVTGPHSVLDVVRTTAEALQRLQREQSPNFQVDVSGGLSASPAWSLAIEVPRHWNEALAVHWTSQTLVIFLRSHFDQFVRDGA